MVRLSKKNNLNLKKLICVLFLAFCSLGLVFSASKASKNKKGSKPAQEQEIETVEKVEAVEEASETEKPQENDSGSKKLSKKEEKRKAREKRDEYTGHVYTVEKKPVIQNDFVRVEALRSPGTFGIYAVNKATKEQVKLISNYEQFSTTFFSLMYGKSLYQLNKNAGVIQELRQTSNSVQVLYRLPNKARVLIDFMPVNRKSEEEFEYIKGDGVVKVCIYATNLSARKTFLAVKGVFDTYLGENSVHFKTAGEREYDTEAKFFETSIEERQWVLSENEKNSIQFLFYGKGITTPEAVYLGNKDTLHMAQWAPPVRDERSFNTVLAYNNSAVGINWQGQFLEKNETQCMVFYIAATPIKKIEFDKPVLTDNPIQLVETPPNAPFVADGLQQVKDDGSVVSADIVKAAEKALEDTGYVPASSSAQFSNVPLANRPQVDFVVPPVTKDKLDPVYIQQLIDRIYSLQNDPQLIDRSEIRRLNAELDSILMKIRQQRN